MSVIHKTITQSNNDDPRDFVFSDESIDAYDDIIRQDGWVQLDDFRRNAIALLGHDSTFPIGTWERVRVEGGKLRGHLKLAPEGTSARIDEVRKLIFARILKACSVGFDPIEFIPRPGSTRGGRIYTKQRLRECSVVAIPANSNALMLEAKSLGVSNSLIRTIFKQSQNESLAERQARARAVTARARETLRNYKPPTSSNRSKPVALLGMSPELRARIARAKAVKAQSLAALASAETTLRESGYYARQAMEASRSQYAAPESGDSPWAEPPMLMFGNKPIYSKKGRFGW